MPYGLFVGYDNGKLAGTVYVETLLELSSSTVYPLTSHRYYCPMRFHFLPQAQRKNQSGKDVFSRLTSTVSPPLTLTPDN